ncbi:flippase [Domibacillus epiphyticus]|uniref:Uncharacterized protein n=1 Tax=Domibacillus epiphyticus TaxID=1714355 RepID=A0A1V2A564_9BACI|nr:flippase [Domibacillus epiphyticus]OMP66116.1 hypothetical protein BTO28_14015 [Domibacillus epiphyticus]
MFSKVNSNIHIIDIFQSDFIKKFIDSLFGKAAYALSMMVFSLILTRLYGVELFGEYSYAFALVTFLMVFARAGLDNGLIYYMPRNGNTYVSFSFLVNTIVSFLIITISLVFIENQYLKWFMPLIWLFSMEHIFFGVYRHTGKFKEFYFINGFLSMLLRIIAAVVAYYLIGKNMFSILIALYSSFLFANMYYFYKNKNRFGKIIFDLEFVKYSYPLVFSSMLGIIMDRIDLIMIGHMMTKTDVGVYQIAVQVATLTSMILLIFNSVFAPKISNLYQADKLLEVKNLYIKSTRILGIISLLTVLILVIFSKYILFLFGAEFIAGHLSLSLRAIGQFIFTAVGSVWYMLSMTGETKLQLYGNLGACLLNVGLNFVLIPLYGINGAAFASMVSVAFINILGYILVCKKFKVKAYKFF